MRRGRRAGCRRGRGSGRPARRGDASRTRARRRRCRSGWRRIRQALGRSNPHVLVAHGVGPRAEPAGARGRGRAAPRPAGRSSTSRRPTPPRSGSLAPADVLALLGDPGLRGYAPEPRAGRRPARRWPRTTRGAAPPSAPATSSSPPAPARRTRSSSSCCAIPATRSSSRARAIRSSSTWPTWSRPRRALPPRLRRRVAPATVGRRGGGHPAHPRGGGGRPEQPDRLVHEEGRVARRSRASAPRASWP